MSGKSIFAIWHDNRMTLGIAKKPLWAAETYAQKPNTATCQPSHGLPWRS